MTVYEAMRVRDRGLPFLARHLARLEANRRALGLAELPQDLSRRLESVARDQQSDGMLRVEWDGGNLNIQVRPLPSLKPIRLVTSSVVHPGYTVKTTNREFFDRARSEAQQRGADDAILLTPEGWVAEGTLFAVGWFDGDSLFLPSLDLGILPSVGRGRVIEVARKLGYRVVEGNFSRTDLKGRAAFIVTATRGVVPILELDAETAPQDARIRQLADNFWPGDSEPTN